MGRIKINIIIATAGVLVALFIGGMQVYIAREQKDVADRQAAIAAIQGEIQAVSSWLPFLKNDDTNVRYMTVKALERIGRGAVAPLVIALSDRAKRVRDQAANALTKIAADEDVEIIVDMLLNLEEKARDAAILALGNMPAERIRVIVARIEKEPELRRFYDPIFASTAQVPVETAAVPSGSPKVKSKEGWAYLGDYSSSQGQWKTQYLDFPSNADPNTLENKTPETTGSLNVRRDMPTPSGALAGVIDVLKPGSRVQIHDVKPWKETGFMWARISYVPQEK